MRVSRPLRASARDVRRSTKQLTFFSSIKLASPFERSGVLAASSNSVYQVEISKSIETESLCNPDVITALADIVPSLREAPLDVGEQAHSRSPLYRRVRSGKFEIEFAVGHPIKAVRIRQIKAS